MTTGKLTPKLRVVYDVVKAAGVHGVVCSQVAAGVAGHGMTTKAVHAALYRLRQMKLVEQEVSHGPYFAIQAESDELLTTLRERCLSMVIDCPGGVSERLMADDLGLNVRQVRRALAQAVIDGTVQRIHMPAAHGGGKGYAVGRPQTLRPGLSVSSRGAFELIDNARLALAWDGARIVLPADVTRGLFRYLDALGGLHNEQRLQPAQGGAA